jgi:hypothetical protein
VGRNESVGVCPSTEIVRDAALIRICLALVVIGGLSQLATAQPRLFAGVNGHTVVEIGTAGADLGRVTREFAIPDCGPGGRMRPVHHGRYLAWTRPGGLCLLSVLDGALRSIDVPVVVPTDVPTLVAVSEDAFGLAVTAGPSASGSAHLLTDPTGALTEAPLPVTLPSVQRHFAIASSANVLVVVLADWGGIGGPPPSATVLRIDLTTGLMLTTAAVPEPLFVNAIAVDRHGTRLLISSADSNLGMRGVFSVQPSTGAVLASNPSVTPRYVADWRTRGEPFFLAAEDDSLIGVVTYEGMVVLDATTLAPAGALDVPRVRLPLLPGYDSSYLGYALHYDPGTSTLFALENEGQMYSYYPGPCLRSSLLAVPVHGGPTRSADLASIYRSPLCGSEASTFMLAAPARPVVTATVTLPPGQPGATVDLDWTVSPAALRYVLEAGTSPGAANLLSQTVTGTSVQVTNVPPGTHFVRIRAVGVAGDSVSQELVLTF